MRGFTAVHLRSLEKTCVARITRQMADGYWGQNGSVKQRVPAQAPAWIQFAAERDIGAEGVCSMSDRYLDALFAHAGTRELPVVLAHDKQNPSRAIAIARKYGAVSYSGTYAPFVDLLLMVRSAYFIGNPASSMSGNAASVRALTGLPSNLAPAPGERVGWYESFFGGTDDFLQPTAD